MLLSIAICKGMIWSTSIRPVRPQFLQSQPSRSRTARRMRSYARLWGRLDDRIDILGLGGLCPLEAPGGQDEGSRNVIPGSVIHALFHQPHVAAVVILHGRNGQGRSQERLIRLWYRKAPVKHTFA